MTKVVFHRAYDFEIIDMSEFLAGELDLSQSSASQIHLIDGKFDAYLRGDSFNPFTQTGTIHEVEVRYKGGPLFEATDMNVELGDVWDNREDGEALKDLFFGGADVFKGSKGNDVLASFDGADKINGAKGNDALIGGGGADTLTGGLDSDSFIYTQVTDSTKKAADLITDLDEANDYIVLQGLTVLGDITSSYSAKKDLTAFSVDVNGDGAADLVITAAGDHVGFEDSGHFLI